MDVKRLVVSLAGGLVSGLIAGNVIQARKINQLNHEMKELEVKRFGLKVLALTALVGNQSIEEPKRTEMYDMINNF